MISSDVIRGYNDTIILHLLMERDSYGYEISRQIEQRSEGNYTIKETTLYSAFARLESRGLIASYYGSETFGKRRTYYTITEQGRSYYRAKCAEWSLTKRVINQFTREDIEDGADRKLCGGDVSASAGDRRGAQDQAGHPGEYAGEV